MKLIASADKNWGIGYQGKLLQRIPEDMKFFKQMTIGKIVVMGRKTFESLSKMKPLVDRVNIVLSRNTSFINEEIKIFNSIDKLLNELSNYNTDDVFVIGGETIYKQLLPFCTDAFITKIGNEYPADKYLDNFDQNDTWSLVSISEDKIYNDIHFKFVHYKSTETT